VPGSGYHGYRFRIIAGRDDQSVALLAWPIAWGETGVMSFMIDQQDTVYQANLGEERRKGTGDNALCPDADAGWQVVNPKKRPVTHATGRFHSLSPGGASETDRRQRLVLCWIMPLRQR
jgi:hypothetical protein